LTLSQVESDAPKRKVMTGERLDPRQKSRPVRFRTWCRAAWMRCRFHADGARAVV